MKNMKTILFLTAGILTSGHASANCDDLVKSFESDNITFSSMGNEDKVIISRCMLEYPSSEKSEKFIEYVGQESISELRTLGRENSDGLSENVDLIAEEKTFSGKELETALRRYTFGKPIIMQQFVNQKYWDQDLYEEKSCDNMEASGRFGDEKLCKNNKEISDLKGHSICKMLRYDNATDVKISGKGYPASVVLRKGAYTITSVSSNEEVKRDVFGQPQAVKFKDKTALRGQKPFKSAPYEFETFYFDGLGANTIEKYKVRVLRSITCVKAEKGKKEELAKTLRKLTFSIATKDYEELLSGKDEDTTSKNSIAVVDSPSMRAYENMKKSGRSEMNSEEDTRSRRNSGRTIPTTWNINK